MEIFALNAPNYSKQPAGYLCCVVQAKLLAYAPKDFPALG